jgi:hypothetical protein
MIFARSGSFASVALLATITALTSGPAAAAWEAKINYVNSNSSACGGSNFSYGDNQASYMNSKLDSWGYDETTIVANGDVDFRDWADIDEHSDGLDHASGYGMDQADVGFLYAHGGRDCTSGLEHSALQMGDPTWYSEPQACFLWEGAYGSTNDVEWGDTDLNIVIADTCQSAHKCVWSHYGYNRMQAGNFGAYLGFHGISYDSLNHKNHFEDYMDGVRYDGLGDDWVDDMTKIWGADNDECAIAITYGSSSSSRDTIFNYGGMQDFKTVTGDSTSFYYIADCNPGDGAKL